MVPPSQAPGLPPDFDPRHAALFLDFDGTLVDIAPTPDTVQVPQGLPDLLARLAARLDGALAIVSGRTLAELDHFLPGPLAKAGEHGAALRLRPDAPVIATLLPAPPASWAARAAELAECFPGVLVSQRPMAWPSTTAWRPRRSGMRAGWPTRSSRRGRTPTS
jgi:trehalose 6-phosphate phosphatase